MKCGLAVLRLLLIDDPVDLCVELSQV